MLCYLSAAGELTSEEASTLEQHLAICSRCRMLRDEIDRMSFFDLSALAAARIDAQPGDDAGHDFEERLLPRLLEQASSFAALPSVDAGCQIAPPCAPSFGFRLSGLFKAAVAGTGWGIAALWLCLTVYHKRTPSTGLVPSGTVAGSPVPDRNPNAHTAGPKDEVQTENEQVKLLSALLSRQEVRTAELQLALKASRGREGLLSSDDESLRERLYQLEETIQTQRSDLESARDALQRSQAAQLQAEEELKSIGTRSQNRLTESAYLEEVAESSHVASSDKRDVLDQNDAAQLLGARDLHIVDVYDVDNKGNAARIYGRVFYVDHRLLLFYAFDLGRVGKDHRAVAFQAWGVRQPDQANPENLGLFYLDDAKVNRWVLRVSNPHVLARIDTLFVTAEPAGGSQLPLGKRLLMASLAGPANHP